jgi:hypothetical protein
MSKLELIHDIKAELKRVNKTIDQKITRGLPYVKEARYHKMLVARLSLMNRSRFLARSMRMVSAFLF